jgi:hypothetical protein
MTLSVKTLSTVALNRTINNVTIIMILSKTVNYATISITTFTIKNAHSA